MMPKTIQTMAWAYQQICAGEDPWTALGNFANAWYSYARERRTTLVSEPLPEPTQETEYTRCWAAFCAASVEFLCDRYQIPCPTWIYHPRYILQTPWYGTVQDLQFTLSEKILQRRIKTTPPPFARRNIFCGNRLFQNKYEMYEWTQEARAKGITDPAQIWHYARQKEISIHGG